MPIVYVKDLDCSNDNSPDSQNVSTQVDLSLLLSEYYGKQIRQGNSFRVNGIQAWVRPADDDLLEFIDVGVSAAVRIGYVPSVKHSRKAWNNVFTQWKKQQTLGGLGPVKHQDMEFAYDINYTTSRTTQIRSTGIGDTNDEYLCLNGNSSGGSSFCLQDYYNSINSELTPVNHFTGGALKAPKFGSSPFPAIQHLYCAATNSASQNVLTSGGAEGLTSAVATSEMNILPTPVNVLCGLLHVNAWVMPDDTTDQIEEDMFMDLAISVTSWKSLVYRPKPKFPRKRKSKGYSRKYWKSSSKKKGKK